MSRQYLALQPSERVLVTSAAQIYAAYVTAGRVPVGDEQQWLQRSVDEALLLGRTIDEKIQADAEMA